MPAVNADSTLAASALEDRGHEDGCGDDGIGCRCEALSLATALDSGASAVYLVAKVEALVAALRNVKDRCFGTADGLSWAQENGDVTGKSYTAVSEHIKFAEELERDAKTALAAWEHAT